MHMQRQETLTGYVISPAAVLLRAVPDRRCDQRTVFMGRTAQIFFELFAKIGCRGKADGIGDGGHRFIGGAQELAGPLQPDTDQHLCGRTSVLFFYAPDQMRRMTGQLLGQSLQRDLFVIMSIKILNSLISDLIGTVTSGLESQSVHNVEKKLLLQKQAVGRFGNSALANEKVDVPCFKPDHCGKHILENFVRNPLVYRKAYCVKIVIQQVVLWLRGTGRSV